MASNITRASHDLNRAKKLVVTGWPGRYVVEPRTDGGHWVELTAPVRFEGEFYTFARTTPDGVLRCHSNLLSSPNLRRISPSTPLVIKLPPDRISEIEVVVEP